MGHDSNGSKELATLTTAERRLAECTELADVMDVRDEMETLRLYAQKQRLGLEVQNQAARIKIQAERRVGEALNALALRGGDRKSKYHEGTLILRLSDLGISRNQSARWQLEAKASSDQFASYCDETEKAGEEVSSTGFRRFIRSTHGLRHRASAREKRHAAHLVVNRQRNQAQASSSVREAFCEIRGHLDSANRMFAAICTRVARDLETVEVREIPRYLREAMALLDEIEQHTEEIHHRFE